MDDIRISPIVMEPPIVRVFISPCAKPSTLPVRQASIVRKMVSPGTSGIIPGIRYTVTGALKMYAAISEYRAIEIPDRKNGMHRESVYQSAMR